MRGVRELTTPRIQRNTSWALGKRGRTREGFIAYDTQGLIDRAAREGFQVLSITNHDTLTFSEELAAYARKRGILLIPGMEATIKGSHVLLYNDDVFPRRG